MPTSQIGLLGLGQFSTEYYRKQIIERWEREMEKGSSCPLIMHSVDFEAINTHLPYGFEILKPIIHQHLLDLNELNVQSIVVPNITLHLTIDQLKLSDDIRNKMAHPFTALFEHLNALKINKVTLFGTRHTMDSELVKGYFHRVGIKLESISTDDIKAVDDLRIAIYKNGSSENSAQKLHEITDKYLNPVLICTELSLINLNCIDIVSLQLDKAMILSGI